MDVLICFLLSLRTVTFIPKPFARGQALLAKICKKLCIFNLYGLIMTVFT